MGNKLSLFKEEEPQAPAQPAKPAPTPAEILALKAQCMFTICISTAHTS